MSAPEHIRREFPAEPADAGRRLDQVAAERWPEFSRSRLAEWIRAGAMRVDGRAVKPNHRLEPGQKVELDAELQPHAGNPEAEPMALDVLYQDRECLVIDKPAGLVVHPGSGNREGTLVSGLLHLDPALEALPRAGLVHRLDKETSGCLLVARTPRAHRELVDALKRRAVHRHYLALVWGQMIAGGHVDAPLGRHPVDRRQQVVRADGRPAVTHYRVERRLAGSTLLRLELETGRTHQIRVHMRHINYPIVGDPVYGRRGSPAGLNEAQREAWRGFSRQALHAFRLEFTSPDGQRPVAVESRLPEDIENLLDILDLNN
ncbi:MAG: RluA family pseudouridine synthase [Wenzhouxiangellaceae bacterium]|nr:RluA family pseudouridine synthase [Wenzhouxiangellaceae bacterium]